MKLYIVKGISIKEKQSTTTSKRIDSFIGYFTNLKEVYNKFDSKTIQSYSTVANRISELNYYSVSNSKFQIGEKMKKYYEIRIERILVNKIYDNSNYIYLDELIAQELSGFKF